jgi:hypothetical protein
MIELHITHTVRQAGPRHAWYRTADTTESFATIPAAKAWCRENLSRRHSPTYRDTPDGAGEQLGRVYHAREREGGRTYYRQYWVEMYDVAITRVPMR